MTYKILEMTSDQNHVFFVIEYMIEGKPHVTRRGFRNEDGKTEQEIEKHIIDIGNSMEEEINNNTTRQNKIINFFKKKMV